MKTWRSAVIGCSIIVTLGAACTTMDQQAGETFDIRAREAEVLATPTRIPPLTHEEMGADAAKIGNDLRGGVGLPPTPEVHTYNAIMLRYPELYQRHSELALVLFNGALELRDRELAILRIGWLCKAPYEWGAHVVIAKRLAGLNSEEIARVKQGSAAPGWSEHDRAVLKAVEELMQNATISDATWAVLARKMNEKQLIELPILVGQYQGVAYVQNTLRVPLDADNEGFAAR